MIYSRESEQRTCVRAFSSSRARVRSAARRKRKSRHQNRLIVESDRKCFCCHQMRFDFRSPNGGTSILALGRPHTRFAHSMSIGCRCVACEIIVGWPKITVGAVRLVFESPPPPARAASAQRGKNKEEGATNQSRNNSPATDQLCRLRCLNTPTCVIWRWRQNEIFALSQALYYLHRQQRQQRHQRYCSIFAAVRVAAVASAASVACATATKT